MTPTQVTLLTKVFYHRHWPAAVLIGGIGLFLVGCEATPSTPATRGPDPVVWSADPQRLPEDVVRAMLRSHWGILRVRVEREPAVHVQARGLLPDGREADVIAWAVDERTVSAGVEIGRFGDPAAEERYLEVLRQTLAGKPKPPRNWKYRLPDQGNGE